MPFNKDRILIKKSVSATLQERSREFQSKQRFGKLCMHLKAATFSIEWAKNYAYRFQFLQVIEG